MGLISRVSSRTYSNTHEKPPPVPKMPFGKVKLSKNKNPFLNSMENCRTFMQTTAPDVSANPFADPNASKKEALSTINSTMPASTMASTMNSTMNSTNENAAMAPIMSSMESTQDTGVT